MFKLISFGFLMSFILNPSSCDPITSNQIAERNYYDDTKFLYFNASKKNARNETEIRCEQIKLIEPYESICITNPVLNATCENLAFQINKPPNWRCDFEHKNLKVFKSNEHTNNTIQVYCNDVTPFLDTSGKYFFNNNTCYLKIFYVNVWLFQKETQFLHFDASKQISLSNKPRPQLSCADYNQEENCSKFKPILNATCENFNYKIANIPSYKCEFENSNLILSIHDYKIQFPSINETDSNGNFIDDYRNGIYDKYEYYLEYSIEPKNKLSWSTVFIILGTFVAIIAILIVVFFFTVLGAKLRNI